MLGNTKHNQVKLVLKVFVSAYLYQYSTILSKTDSISKIILDTFYLKKHLTIK